MRADAVTGRFVGGRIDSSRCGRRHDGRSTTGAPRKSVAVGPLVREAVHECEQAGVGERTVRRDHDPLGVALAAFNPENDCLVGGITRAFEPVPAADPEMCGRVRGTAGVALNRRVSDREVAPIPVEFEQPDGIRHGVRSIHAVSVGRRGSAPGGVSMRGTLDDSKLGPWACDDVAVTVKFRSPPAARGDQTRRLGDARCRW